MKTKLRHVAANAIDWYLNKVNEAHLLPVNLATLIRDISAKQVGGKGFRPRPLTAANFTDRELDAILRLVSKAKKGRVVDYKTYSDDLKLPKTIERQNLSKYLAPFNAIRTTLGQFSVHGPKGDERIKDTYDFNRTVKWKILDHGDGTFSFRNLNWDGRIERLPKRILESILSRRRDGAYGLIRQNAANFGHLDDDPDNEKIKVDIPLSEIKKRLGGKEGKLDITTPMTDDEFRWRSAGAGMSLGAPIGAALGLMSGGIKLLGKKARKRWIKTILTHALGGAALGAAAGGIGTWISAGKAIEKFNSNKMNEKVGSSKETRKIDEGKKVSIIDHVINTLSYAIPLAAISGIGLYGVSRLKSLRDKMLNPEQDLYSLKNERIEFVKNIKDL